MTSSEQHSSKGLTQQSMSQPNNLHKQQSHPQTNNQTESHPEDTDPLGRQGKEHKSHPEENRMTMTLAIILACCIILVPIIAVISESPVVNIIVGLLPLLTTIIFSIVLVKHHYKLSALWILLAFAHALGLAVVYFLNFLLSPMLNVSSALGTSLFVSILIMVFVTLSSMKDVKKEFPKKRDIVEFKPEKIDEYVQAIEDKLKAINFAVGRVYRSSNGGTTSIRERLRIPSDWYNEFHAIPSQERDKQLGKAKVLVRKIHDRLGLMKHKEKEIFSSNEVAALKHLVRNKDGEDAVIQVLTINDRDPVEHYYTSANEFCERILKELENIKEKS